MSMKMLWLLALICRDFPCIICSKKIRFVVGIENVVVVVCTQQAAGKRNPPALPALPNGNGETTPTRGFSPGVQAGMEDQKNSRWRVPGTGYASLRCQSRPNRGIPRGESGIGSPLPSIATTRVILDTARGLEPC